MARWVKGKTAERARWSTGLDEDSGPDCKSGRLLASDGEADDVSLLVIGDQLFYQKSDPIDLLVVGDAEGSYNPMRFCWLLEIEVIGEMTWAVQLGKEATEVLGDDGNLLLLGF